MHIEEDVYVRWEKAARTASCFSFVPSVVRMVVSFARRLRYCVARVSFSSRVRSSSLCNCSTGSESLSPPFPRPLVKVVVPLMPLELTGELVGGEDVRSLSKESLRSAIAWDARALEVDPDVEVGLGVFRGLAERPFLDIIFCAVGTWQVQIVY